MTANDLSGGRPPRRTICCIVGAVRTAGDVGTGTRVHVQTSRRPDVGDVRRVQRGTSTTSGRLCVRKVHRQSTRCVRWPPFCPFCRILPMCSGCVRSIAYDIFDWRQKRHKWEGWSRLTGPGRVSSGLAVGPELRANMRRVSEITADGGPAVARMIAKECQPSTPM